MLINKTIVIVTTYCGGTHQVNKRHMTKTLCKNLKAQGLDVCLVSHSPIDIETQSWCDLFVYDADNSFQQWGLPNRTDNHGVAELTSMWNAIAVIERKEYTHFLKVSYDNIPNLDYVDLIKKCEDTGKHLVTAKWGNNITLGSHMYYSSVDLFIDTCGPHILNRCDKDLEYAWFDAVNEYHWMDNVHLIENYHDFLGHDIIQYCHAGGKIVDGYPYE